MTRRTICSLAIAGTLLSIPLFPAKKTAPPAPAVAQMTADQKILHALNRLAYGPRPGDVEAIQRIGLDKWINAQLHPETQSENPQLVAKLQVLETLSMPTDMIVDSYPPPGLVKAMVDGRIPFPQDPMARVALRRLVERYEIKDDGKNAKTAEQKASSERARAFAQKPDWAAVFQKMTPEQQDSFKNGAPLERVKTLESLDPVTQADVIDLMSPQQRQGLFALASPTLRRRISMLQGGGQQVVYTDLTEGKLLRAVYSNKQLEEVLTDFWFNHFNVFFDKGQDRIYTTGYERDVIRPNVLGKFKDLLLADAQSPAMLFYLDNVESVGANSQQFMSNRGPKRGLNENYGRELMELHTLGVDGGYTQKDVTEVARCFTGWSIRNAFRGGNFEFQARLHDNGEKTVLGVKIPAGGGMDDGLKVLDILVHHPSTAKFISRKLAIRFVSDNPPAALVDRMAQTFQSTDGDLREVMRVMVTSPEFFAPEAFHAKVKTPLEMVASALRATNADLQYGQLLIQQLNVMGQPLYRKVEPTGYSSKNAEWMNSAALLARMNFSLALVSNRVPGVKIDLKPYESVNDPNTIAHALLMTDLSENARKAIQMGVDNPEILQQVNQRAQQNGGPGMGGPGEMMAGAQGRRNGGGGGGLSAVAPNKTALLAGLTLGSPDFQRR